MTKCPIAPWIPKNKILRVFLRQKKIVNTLAMQRPCRGNALNIDFAATKNTHHIQEFFLGHTKFSVMFSWHESYESGWQARLQSPFHHCQSISLSPCQTSDRQGNGDHHRHQNDWHNSAVPTLRRFEECMWLNISQSVKLSSQLVNASHRSIWCTKTGDFWVWKINYKMHRVRNFKVERNNTEHANIPVSREKNSMASRLGTVWFYKFAKKNNHL